MGYGGGGGPVADSPMLLTIRQARLGAIVWGEINFDAGLTMSGPVVIADDHPLFRAALVQAVSGAAPDRRVLETSSLEDAHKALKSCDEDGASAGLLCLDLHMSDSEGFAGLIAVRHDRPSLPVIVISGSEGPGVAARALGFGASAFVPKSSDIAVIREAVEAVLAGDIWAPPGSQAADEGTEANAAAARLATLTPTQLRVLTLVRDGLLNKQIAYELSISEATVKAHLTAIFRKLDVHTRTQAVLAAHGLDVDRPAPKEDG